MPISAVVEKLFGWSDYFVEWTSNAAGISFTCTVLVWASVVDSRNGARKAALGACAFLVLCAGLRVVSASGAALQQLQIVSQVCNGLAGAPIALVPPVLSAAWFPQEERTTATGVMVTMNVGGGPSRAPQAAPALTLRPPRPPTPHPAALAQYLGQAVGFFLGPSVVPFRSSPSDPARRSACSANSDCSGGDGTQMCAADKHCETVCTLLPSPECDAMRSDLDTLFWAQGVAAIACLLLTAAYFPSAPPSPPSRTAALHARRDGSVAGAAGTAGAAGGAAAHDDFVAGIRQLLRHRRFWVLLLAFALPLGILSGWFAALGENLKSLGFDQANAGYIGAASILGGVVGGIAVPVLADWLAVRHGTPPPLKELIVYMYAGASVAFGCFALQCAEVLLPRTLGWIYVSAVVGGACLNGTIPLFYELCVETTFPIGEGSTEAFLVLLQNLVQTIFLAVPPSALGGTAWMNWSLALATPFFLVMLLPFKPQYLRYAIDHAHASHAPTAAAAAVAPS